MATDAYDEEVMDLRRGANLENLGLDPTRIPPNQRMRSRGPPIDRCVGAGGGSNRKIESRLPERAEEFNLRAAVHDDFEAGVFRKFGGLVVIDADLPP